MFERFTDRARRVVVLAQEEARMLNHNYIGTEHILLGLIHEGEGVAAKALESLGISLDAVRQQVEEIIGQGQQAPSGHIPFTPRAKKVLELSLREALQLGHNYIGTEHILLGLIREGDGVAAQVLVKLGADLNRVRQQVIQLLHGYQDQDVGSPDSPLGERARAGLPGDALAWFDALDRRLTALERWVSMQPDLEDLDQEIAQVRREKEAAAARQDSQVATALRDKEKQLLADRADREKEWAGSAAGRRTVASELDRLNTEVERLRATLREHGIEPGDAA
jgi:ATP-dependent Clp protease ATP-binding subunit ClpC